METMSALEPVDALEVLDRLLDADLSERCDEQLSDDLRTLEILTNRLDGEKLRRLAAFDSRGGASVDHAQSTQSWLRALCRLSPSAAAGRVRLARRLREESPLQIAVRAGDVSYAHAQVVARALDDLPPEAAVEAEPILVMHARSVDPMLLRRTADTVREMVAPELLLIDEQTRHEKRRLSVSETFDGMVAIDGLLDPEGGAVVLAAVNALATPMGPSDGRTAAQRRADALVEGLHAALNVGAYPEQGGQKPHVTVTVDYAHLVASGRVVIGRGDYGTQLVGETVRRILCDAQITRVVTAGPSEVLDVGRATRVIPPAMRRALHAMYGGCGGEDCFRPPAFTDIHHVFHWAHGGETRLPDLVPLCRYHHNGVHDGIFELIRMSGDRWLAVPKTNGPSRYEFY